MKRTFSIEKFKGDTSHTLVNQYNRQISRLTNSEIQVSSIEEAVRGALKNLNENECNSFVIYGEPQSGKTEMMICLTAKLLDEGYRIIVHMLNDSVDLLSQNLGRFTASGLAPSARNFSEILDPSIKLDGQKHIIFCKKNARDLEKLISKTGNRDGLVVIDDEADFASPNSKVNKGDVTRINALIQKLPGREGIYIGVTATPARLDLNNTFDNDSTLWVNFPPHQLYTGQDVFFSVDSELGYRLTLLSDAGDNPRHMRRALFGFLVSSAYLNNYVNKKEENYTFLVHTSGKKIDHKADWVRVGELLGALGDKESPSFDRCVKEIWDIAQSRYSDVHPDELVVYILNNISRYKIILLNSDRDLTANPGATSNPPALFTIIVGGNIVSRGVTFNNLLSMFFTRDVKHKIQQDTYIQRARMFGARGHYLGHFELTIPERLYLDWQRAFVFHKLALEAIRSGLGSPVWLGDSRISVVAPSSIDHSTVDLDRGEMSFPIFALPAEIERIIVGSDSPLAKMEKVAKRLGPDAFPFHLQKFISRTMYIGDESLALHPIGTIENYKDGAGVNKELIVRDKGLMGQTARDFPKAVHHLKIFTNASGKARLFYKFDGSIQFIQNRHHA
ncbi:MAG: Z1 domain-containing protein [Dongiaceae bacterium]